MDVHHKPRRRDASAFTLVELLTVIAIIGILAALLLPGLSRSKDKAQQTACIGNLHQLGVGLQSFVTANRAYPSAIGPTNSENSGFWISQLASGGFGNDKPLTNYLEQGVWHCPTAPYFIPWNGGSDEPFCSYGYNVYGILWPGNQTNALGLHGDFVPGATFIPGHRGFAPVRESEVAVPADMMAIADSIIGGVFFERWRLQDLDRGGRATRRHQGKIDVLFCDGHVESPTLKFVFDDTNDVALVRWNRDHQAHREKL